ncbi:MAG: hypothetical protein WC480_04500 [Patescibacteria group bacterium]
MKISWSEINRDGLETIACVDLGGFHHLGNNKLLNKVSAVVIMEDRRPDFFVGYDHYEPHKDTTLNRHGPRQNLSTQQDLKKLVGELQQQKIKVYFGFWGQVTDNQKKMSPWIKNHPELWPEYKASQDLNPLAILGTEKMTFADYICQQYQKLQQDFGFDGLFLGDGLNGYRVFSDPTVYQDKINTTQHWNLFYYQIARKVHQLGGKLLAYDCLGREPKEALKHGADYLSQADGGLDYLVVQTYPTAWGKFWLKKFPGFDFKSCLKNLERTKELLKNTNCRVLYTLEISDSVEEWQGEARTTHKQLQKFRHHSDGKVLVWANELIARDDN